MSLTSLFEKIAGKQRQRDKAKHAEYRALVARIAGGKETDPDTVDRVLAEAGKTLRNLQEDIGLGKTGTTSLHEALTILGWRSIHNPPANIVESLLAGNRGATTRGSHPAEALPTMPGGAEHLKFSGKRVIIEWD